jgi:hypothetical protein
MDGWMDGWICASLAPEELDELYSYSLCNCLSFTGQFSVITDIPAPMIRAPEMGPKTKRNFLENSSNNFD